MARGGGGGEFRCREDARLGERPVDVHLRRLEQWGRILRRHMGYFEAKVHGNGFREGDRILFLEGARGLRLRRLRLTGNGNNFDGGQCWRMGRRSGECGAGSGKGVTIGGCCCGKMGAEMAGRGMGIPTLRIHGVEGIAWERS